MKSVVVVVPDLGRARAVRQLGALGVLHLRNLPAFEEDGELDRLESAIRILDAAGEAPGDPGPSEDSDPARLVDDVLGLAGERDGLDARIAELELEIERIAPLGDFDGLPPDLTDKGLEIRLYRCPVREFANLAASFPCSVIYRRRSELWVAVVSRSSDDPPTLPEVPLPSKPPGPLKAELGDNRRRRRDVDDRLLALGGGTASLRKEAERLHDRRALRRALGSVRAAPPVATVTGYCPEPRLAELEHEAEDRGWALLARDVEPDEDPPTLLANSRWIAPAEAIYRMIESVPGYREPDTSLGFIIYLTLFFAILVGDAGYGLLVLAAAAAWRRWGDPPSEVSRLIVLLGSGTLAWGALSGNWFGLEGLATAPGLAWLVMPGLNAFDAASQSVVMGVCFLIGASHLSAAHLTVAFHRRHSSSALCQVGWALVVWGAFFVVRFLVLEIPIPAFTYGLLAVGAGFAALFAQPDRGFVHGIAIGLGRLPLRLMSCFGDLISYIRLFAVGMATLAVAASFNEIAAGFGWENPAAALLAVLVLVLGHGINLAMAALSVVVHGVRLNMLEFSGHAELEWAGTAYSPFRLIDPDRTTLER